MKKLLLLSTLMTIISTNSYSIVLNERSGIHQSLCSYQDTLNIQELTCTFGLLTTSFPTIIIDDVEVDLNNEIESENQITTEIMEMQIDETTTTPALDAIAKTIKKDPAVVKAAALKLYNQGGALTSEAVINASR